MSHARVVDIRAETSDPALDLCLDTVAKKKQAIVFCSTKRGAESQAERTAHALPRTGAETVVYAALAEEALLAVSSPTKQCHRLAACLRKGVAFHHAGLHAKQRDLVETKFREGVIGVICSTPTLAMGLDLPAFRVVIRDLKRFGDSGAWGMADIPVLEYEQMAGRAGRPGKESFGEAVILADTDAQEEQRIEQYLRGSPEEIYSKLAVEPVLRMYVLSLVAAEFVGTTQGLRSFFDATFYAKQYGDTAKIHRLLDLIVEKLQEWEFLEAPETSPKKGLFVSARELASRRDDVLRATPLGKRVAELYLDPYTGNFLIECLRRATPSTPDVALLHMLTSCLELRPLLRPKVKELDEIVARFAPLQQELLAKEPARYTDEYEEFLMTAKTALFLKDWIEETHEDALFDAYGAGPGEIHAKLERADWLLYACEELARLLSLHPLRTPLGRLRVRLKHGAKEELLALLQLKNVGRVRARKLYGARITTLQHVKDADVSTLAALVGKQVALDLKRQVGQDVSAEHVQVKPHKRKGQTSMADFA